MGMNCVLFRHAIAHIKTCKASYVNKAVPFRDHDIMF
jgi:hypothetical protein